MELKENIIMEASFLFLTDRGIRLLCPFWDV
jgi:hypothetical protein